MSINVEKPGLLTTVQDLGRRGGLAVGMPLNGVLDERAHRIANFLVGNPANTATLEVTMLGPQLHFSDTYTIALAGADLSPTLNGQSMPMHQAVVIRAGSVLAFAQPKAGIRLYMAVQGGLKLTPVLDSVSTNLRAQYGGFMGRALRKGDRLMVAQGAFVPGPHHLPAAPLFGEGVVRGAGASLRIVAGREHTQFTQESVHDIVAEPYHVSLQSDRMGYRLQGKALQRHTTVELYSEAVCAGTVQVPADGQPIVLLSDAQTTGGYPRIAQVIAVDLPRLAQRAPNEVVRFEWVSVAEAQRLAVRQQRVFAALAHRV